MTARLLIGDVRDRLAELPDHSVDLVVTSPPFWKQRECLPSDHPLKKYELGREPTPGAWLDNQLDLVAAIIPKLAPYGSICFEIGDKYSGSGGAGGDYDEDGWHEGQEKFGSIATIPGMPKHKSLLGLPNAFPFALAWGYNPIRPSRHHDESPAGEWRVRNLLTWCRPNPPVGALGDKFRPATSFVTVATMGRDRWFDLDAVRGPGSTNTHARLAKGVGSRPNTTKVPPNGSNRDTLAIIDGDGGAPPLDWDAPDDWDQLFADALDDFLAAWWQPLVDLPTQPYGGAHYATFPMELPRRLIEAMCPRQVCVVCGEPRRRIVGEAEYTSLTDPTAKADHQVSWSGGGGRSVKGLTKGSNTGLTRTAPTLGWTTCGHGTWRNGIVLDPFSGSGITLAAATGCGRDAIGVDIDDRNVDLCRERVGLFLEVEEAA